MLRFALDAYADMVGRMMELAVTYPAHTIGAVALVIGFVIVYNPREDLAL